MVRAPSWEVKKPRGQLSPQHTMAPAYNHRVLQKRSILSGALRHKALLAPLPLLLTRLLVDTSFRLMLQWNLLYILTAIKSH